MGGKSSTRQRAPGSGQVLSRRKIFKGAVGMAAAGAGGAVLTAATASPAVGRRAGHDHRVGGDRAGRGEPDRRGDDRGGRLPGQRLPA